MDFCSCGRRIDRFDYKNPSANARRVIDTAVEAKVRGQRALGVEWAQIGPYVVH